MPLWWYRWSYQSTIEATERQESCALAKGRLGLSGLYFTLLYRDLESGLTMETLGLVNDRMTPNISNLASSVAARMALPLSACRISGCLRPLLIRPWSQALLT